jgi:integrase
MASTSSRNGARSRHQLQHQGRLVPNVYVRHLADGSERFEYVVGVDGRQVRQTLRATTATDAVREADRLRVISAESGVQDGTVRLSVLADRFLEESRTGQYVTAKGPLAESTLGLYEQRLHSHVLPALGYSTRLRDVRVEHLRKLIDRLRLDGLSGSTIRGTIAAVRAMLRFAVHRGLAERSVALDLDGDLPSGKRQTEPVYLSRGEIDALLAGLGAEFRPVAATCAFAALRISEALGLTWGDVDFAARTLSVSKQLSRDGKELVALKTSTSEAVLSLPAPLAEELRSHRDRQARIGFDRIVADALVFQTRRGRPQSKRNALRAVQLVAARQGIEGSDGQPLGLHDLRHSTAGLLREAGLADEEIAVVLRHANARVTSTMYGSRSDEAKVAVRQRAAEALA